MEEQQGYIITEQPESQLPYEVPPVVEAPVEAGIQELPEPVIRHGYLTCPECGEKGVVKTFNDPRGLGLHRRLEHKVMGTSSGAIEYRKRKALEEGRSVRPIEKGRRPQMRFKAAPTNIRARVFEVLENGPITRGDLGKVLNRPGGPYMHQIIKVIRRLEGEGKVITTQQGSKGRNGKGAEVFSLPVRGTVPRPTPVLPATREVPPPPVNLAPIPERKAPVATETQDLHFSPEALVGYAVRQCHDICERLADQADIPRSEFTKRCAELLHAASIW